MTNVEDKMLVIVKSVKKKDRKVQFMDEKGSSATLFIDERRFIGQLKEGLTYHLFNLKRLEGTDGVEALPKFEITENTTIMRVNEEHQFFEVIILK